MIQLLYTGANVANESQTNPFLSLGGYVSSTPAQNAIDGNVFSTITEKDLYQKDSLKQSVVLAIKNISNDPLTNFQIYFETEQDSIANYTIAQLPILFNDCNEPYTERLVDNGSLPFTIVDKKESPTLSDPFLLDNLQSQDYFVILLLRELNNTEETETEENERIIQEFEEQSKRKHRESFKIFFTYS